ncbi:MAG TPA: Crp/Fnr family transcriptional regulator [Ktedonobacterales bacterium]|jgi:CRP-like cAMP-binding protein
MYEDTLSQVPIFKDLSQRELQILGATCREREFAANTTLLRQGETGVGLFVITSGAVSITQHQEGGAEHEIAQLRPGDVLGEMSLLDDLPRSATATATETTRALSLPVWDFRAALREAPEIGIKLLAILSQRLRRVEQRGS